ncbi:hypothetical protein [Mycoplasmopsis fermentans]|nr:hypothetical protein [Mycoplasmopsis fermentans]ADN68911.1 hypothetical membrane associated protein [Mycoplasmopsis fermentans JER]ADV34333.1 Putative Carbamoyl-phosphate synthase large subunit [Mycoplasmopsis fermentans M64]VEU60356.1 Uncharacterised protein [Mycoplasmopsis fermentans]VEU67498.1 Uncharacterised protein [Mesomycoplasma conjunctivae]
MQRKKIKNILIVSSFAIPISMTISASGCNLKAIENKFNNEIVKSKECVKEFENKKDIQEEKYEELRESLVNFSKYIVQVDTLKPGPVSLRNRKIYQYATRLLQSFQQLHKNWYEYILKNGNDENCDDKMTQELWDFYLKK